MLSNRRKCDSAPGHLLCRLITYIIKPLVASLPVLPVLLASQTPNRGPISGTSAYSSYVLLPPLPGAAYETNYEELKVQKGESWLYHAKRLEEFLAGKEYILGSKISWTDFLLFETTDFQRFFVPGSLDAYPNLKAFSARIAALPQVTTHSVPVSKVMM